MVIRRVYYRGGHNFACKGASALIDETTEDRRVAEAFGNYLRSKGIEAIDCTPGNCNVNADLQYGVAKANAGGADLFVSIHFNKCYGSYDGKIGTEVCVYSKFQTAQDVVDNIESLGFVNRGQKVRTELYELRSTSCPAMIVECCFVEATGDVNTYKQVGPEAVAKAIADGILGQTTLNEGSTSAPSNPQPVLPPASEDTSRASVSGAKAYVGGRCNELQTLLIACGYSCGGFGADGAFGQGTYDSLIKFQEDSGLDADGLAGKKTFDALNAKVAASQPKPSSRWDYQYDEWVKRLQSRVGTTADGVAGENTLNACKKFTISRGESGTLCKLVQERLNKMGYNAGSVDGVVGNGTMNAIYAFQRAYGLGTGYLGGDDWYYLIK